MNPNESDNISIERPRRHPLDDQFNDLKNDRVGVEERPARPLETNPVKEDTNKEFECVCSNCGHVIPKVEGVQCPSCPVCNGHMEVV